MCMHACTHMNPDYVAFPSHDTIVSRECMQCDRLDRNAFWTHTQKYRPVILTALLVAEVFADVDP